MLDQERRDATGTPPRDATPAAFELQPTLTGALIVLRPLTPADFDALAAAAGDPLIWAQHPEPGPCGGSRAGRKSGARFRTACSRSRADGPALRRSRALRSHRACRSTACAARSMVPARMLLLGLRLLRRLRLARRGRAAAGAIA